MKFPSLKPVKPALGLMEWLLPCSFIAGVAGVYFSPLALSGFLPTAAVPLTALFSILVARRHPGPALLLLVTGSALMGHLLVGTHLRRHLSDQPKAEDLNRVYHIEARVLYGWETDYGGALKVDRIRMLSPADPGFRLSRLTLYTPELSEQPANRGTIKAWILLKKTKTTHPFPWPMQRLRERFLPTYAGTLKDLRLMEIKKESRIIGAGLSDGNRELLNLLLYGQPGWIWQNRLEPFGLTHLLAISGLHCIFAYLGLQLLLWPLRRPVLRSLLTVIGLLGFAHWAGWSVSVTRAALMLSFWQVIPGWGRTRSWIRLWCALMLITLLSEPHALLLRGFWYSFAASLGLILGHRTEIRSPLHHPWQRFLRMGLPILSAQCMVLPINLIFNCHSRYTSLFWNFFGFVVLVVLGLLLLLCLGSLLVPLLVPVANRADGLLTLVTEHLALEPGTLEIIRFPYHPLWVLLVLGLLFAVLRHGPREIRWYLLLGLLIFFGLWGRPLRGERFVMLDVGQGLCMVYISPRGEATLFDAGGRLPPGVHPARVLKLLGAKSIKRAFVSHLNRDHYSFLEQFEPLFPLFVPAPQMDRFQTYASLTGFPLRPIGQGFSMALGNHRLQALWPPPRAACPDDNECSLVLLLETPDLALLMTGDAGLWMESYVPLAAVPAGSVLQVGHHGSKTATGTAFLRRLDPRCALISCGPDNPFGHPHPRVVNDLELQAIPTFITRDHGTLQLLGSGTRFADPFGRSTSPSH